MPRHTADHSPDPSPEPPTDPELQPGGAGDDSAGDKPRIVSPRGVRLTAYVVGLALLVGGFAAVKFGHTSPASDSATATRGDERGSRGEVRPTIDPSATPTPTTSADVSLGTSPTVAPAAVTTPPPPPPAKKTTPAKPKPAAPAAGCSAYSGNRLIACNLLPSFGFSTSEMAALDPMWDKESGWNASAENPSSGAYGIPQSLPGSKMASAGGDWRTNPATQIKWGLDYIKGRYGSPSGAWSFWQANGWY